MNNFFNKVMSGVQVAADKSKEIADIAKLNLSITSTEDQIQDLAAIIGRYVIANGLLHDDPSVAPYYEKTKLLENDIILARKKISEIKNIILCPNCKFELPKGTKFCSNCGSAIAEDSPIIEVVSFEVENDNN